MVISGSLPAELRLEISENFGKVFDKPSIKLTSGFHIGLSRRVDQEVGIFSYSTSKFKEIHFLTP